MMAEEFVCLCPDAFAHVTVKRICREPAQTVKCSDSFRRRKLIEVLNKVDPSLTKFPSVIDEPLRDS